MSKIIDFYRALEKKKKIVFLIASFVLFLSILRVSLWAIRRNKTPTPKIYLKYLKSPNKEEKKYGIYIAGNLKIKEILPEIEKIFLQDEDLELKRISAYSIGQIDFNKLLSYLDSSDKTLKEITFETILKLDRKNIEILINRFDKEDKETKLKILSYMKSPAYQDKLLKIIENKDEDLEIRQKALGLIKDVGKWEEIEVSLWNCYYEEENPEFKKNIYDTIKEFQKRGK
ncbi:MAG: hypothetical protein NC926_04890 [Candidatus Omnitrophica bacterium]|nr:hypothetical protein [Candidatus Omnitrophota bacterium]MCM8807278.1 hypothetical protein [Candidatus Omnitrophota bacterium]